MWSKGNMKRGKTQSKLGCVIQHNSIVLTEGRNKSKWEWWLCHDNWRTECMSQAR